MGCVMNYLPFLNKEDINIAEVFNKLVLENCDSNSM